MRIRTRLTLQFAVLVAIILAVASLAVYFLSADYRKLSFYDRLTAKAQAAASLLVQNQYKTAELERSIPRNSMILNPVEIRIFNAAHQEIFNSNPKDKINLSERQLALLKIKGELRFSEGEKDVEGLYYQENGNELLIFISAFDKFGYYKLYNLRWILIGVSLGSFILACLLGWMYTGAALRPIAGVVSQVDRITAANLNLRVNSGNGRDEIALLAVTFNKMLERLESAFEMQKSFVSNSSHELRTPLTSLSGQIEVSLLKERTAGEYKVLLLSMQEDIQSLITLSNGLLTLAQASVDRSKILLQPLRIDEILWQARADLLRAHPEYEVVIGFDEEPDDEDKLVMKGNEILLNIAFLNLMENACKFSSDHKAEVEISTGARGVTVRVRDKGIGIEPHEIKQIFEPFFRASNSWKVKGHGLGLSLTQRIVQIHNGNIEVQSLPSKGTEFITFFPKSEVLANAMPPKILMEF